MNNWKRRIVLGSAVGAVVGVLVGLAMARLLWLPVGQVLPPTPSMAPATATPQVQAVLPEASTTPDNHADELVLISALYALDGDLARARQRLETLNLSDPNKALEDLALERAATGSEQLATDLATLAAALGSQSEMLLAYVASPTATATPTHTPTATATAPPTATATPQPTATSPPVPTAPPTRRPATPLPPTATSPPAATPLALDWDPRVSILEPPIRLVEAQVAPGEVYWRLVRLEWWKASEGGNTLMYISTLNERGQPVWGQPVIVEHGASETIYTDPKPGEAHGANYPMTGMLNSYIVFVGGDLPSDRVTGLGLGERQGSTDHTTFVLVFQRTTR